MKNLNYLMLANMMFGMTAMAQSAGNGAGNGGIGVVCRNSDGSIKSARVLDLLEGEQRDQFHYSKKAKEASTQASARRNGELYANMWSGMDSAKEAKFVSFGLGLPNPKDFNPRVTIKDPSCKFEVIALYDDIQRTLSVDQEIFDRLPEFDQTAIFWHESLYKIARNNGNATTSDRVRKFNAYLLSDEGYLKDATLFGDLSAGAPTIVCFVYYGDISGKNYERLFIDGVRTENLWFIVNKENTQVTVGNKRIQFIRSYSHLMEVRVWKTAERLTARFGIHLGQSDQALWSNLDQDNESEKTSLSCGYRD